MHAIARRFLLPLLALPLLLGMARKPALFVRFHVEANQQDTERFATAVTLKNPPRTTFMERVPAVSEKHIRAIYPFQAADGSWGCAFQLKPDGRLALEVVSTEHRGASLIAFIGTKHGTHQVIDMIIDQRITDGVITIQRGLTEMEVGLLQKAFPSVGAPRKASRDEEKAEATRQQAMRSGGMPGF